MEPLTAGDDILDPVVASALARMALPHEVLACDPQWADTAEFCQQYGIPAANTCNTIIVALKTNPRRYAACLVPSNTRLDVNHKLSALTGTRRLSFASGEETSLLTGMRIGGVTIIGLPPDMPLYVDSRVLENDYIIVGGGNRSSKVRLDPRLLTKMANASVADIANPLV